MPMATVEALHIYPVKSLGGIALDAVVPGPLGLQHDRRWMVVRADNGRFVTQRENAQLALVRLELTDSGVRLGREGHGSVNVLFDDPGGHTVDTAVWSTEVTTNDMGNPPAEWLTAATHSDHPLRLVRMQPGFRRPTRHAEVLGEATTTLFADAAPFLVANLASLDALNDELQERGHDAVPMDRFRPNIVLSGLPAFAEHDEATLSRDGLELQLRGPCERCVVTTIDQHTGERDPDNEPFRTLRDINPVPGKPAPAFAQYASLEAAGTAPLRVGDRLEY